MAIESVDVAQARRAEIYRKSTLGEVVKGSIRAPFSFFGDPARFMMGGFQGFFGGFVNDAQIPAEAVENYQGFGYNGRERWFDSMDAEEMGELIGSTVNYAGVTAWMMGSAYCAAISDLSQASYEGAANYIVAGTLLTANVLIEGHRRLEDWLNRPALLPSSGSRDNEENE